MYRLSGLKVWDRNRACPGYTLYCHLQCDNRVLLVDMRGEPLHVWNVGMIPNYGEILQNGNLVVLGFLDEMDINQKAVLGHWRGRVIREFSWDGQLLWEYRSHNIHHDFDRLPNGNTLLLCNEFIPANVSRHVRGGLSEGVTTKLIRMAKKGMIGVLLKQEGLEESNDKGEVKGLLRSMVHRITGALVSGNELDLRGLFRGFAWTMKYGMMGVEVILGMDADYFVEVTPRGEVVWEWHAYEHLDFEEDVICPLCNRREWTHANSCEVLENGDVLTAFRQINTVAIVDRKTGELRWKWGAGELGHPHNPTMLPNGNVLLFDNGMHINPFPRSRVLEINPRTNRVVWSYQGESVYDFFSPIISGAQRLWNGNTLICDGNHGRIFEVTPDGDVVWEFYNPHYTKDKVLRYILPNLTHNWVYRAHRYPVDYPGFKNRDLPPPY